MSAENLKDIPDDKLLESARQIAEELERRGLRLSRALGEHAVDGAEYDNMREEADPFLTPGSQAAKDYARERGPSGRRRWMRPFAKTDLFGRPTVFSNGYDSRDRDI